MCLHRGVERWSRLITQEPSRPVAARGPILDCAQSREYVIKASGLQHSDGRAKNNLCGRSICHVGHVLSKCRWDALNKA
ncbi:hypothetical protein BRCON_2112 [Candidatus Sumerlaea chitinivorans]|uniref:Uncharacterized protein n=1 Tax=Sumerlaea chitinivorans TaxID=2250252 RepID=A0A2Z4Y7L6_SUMC1|nr:hypothetical protein BRCON_2112 [Candidatus Sumerlaea chitinivorans]